jgi:hypothetical protein
MRAIGKFVQFLILLVLAIFLYHLSEHTEKRYSAEEIRSGSSRAESAKRTGGQASATQATPEGRHQQD